MLICGGIAGATKYRGDYLLGLHYRGLTMTTRRKLMGSEMNENSREYLLINGISGNSLIRN